MPAYNEVDRLGISFADLFAISTLYHLVSWLVFFGDRVQDNVPGGDPSQVRLVWRRITWVHVPPALLCGILVLDSTGTLWVARGFVFSPAIYLFWSFLHTLQTVGIRGFERTTST